MGYVRGVSYRIVDPETVSEDNGSDVDASPFDRSLSAGLRITAFELSEIRLPAGESTVRHDHVDDRVEDVYVVLGGAGWLVLDDDRVPLAAGQSVAVDIGHERFMLAGPRGLDFLAICAPSRAAPSDSQRERGGALARLRKVFRM
jgi:mannose-6-phosphate isomerase-like protein (cupin superfamily)